VNVKRLVSLEFSTYHSTYWKRNKKDKKQEIRVGHVLQHLMKNLKHSTKEQEGVGFEM
jgi:hypothetical protein